MLRNTLARNTAVDTPPAPIPSIRLISATPSATGMSSDANTTANYSWDSVPSPLAPKTDPPKKRLVPKKSKLGLLGVGREKEKGKDLSDVVRRVGGGSTATRGGFEIYVDPTEDPEMGDIVMVKKKKSRVALDGMRWGALGEVTNVPSVAPKAAPALLKVKAEEKDKWWSIGRGRKDSKEKEKEKAKEAKSKPSAKLSEPPRPEPVSRSKTPEPLNLSQETRARFNSLDSGILLNTPVTMGPPEPITYSRSGTPTAGGLLAPPSASGPGPNQGSIAIRAMRSVRSLARIGSWAQLKNGDDDAPVPVKKSNKENATKGDAKKKKKKEKKEKEKEKAQTVRNSSSSFEVGALTASPDGSKTLGKKKHSIMGLGLPSTVRIPTVRAGSTASSAVATTNRLSVESAVRMGRDRAGSTMSSGSSLRPLSTTSSTSRASSSSSASVRWDEEGLETVKEQRKKERACRKKEEANTERQKRGDKDGGSRRSAEGRKRTPLSSVFPDSQGQTPPESEPEQPEYPILTVEAATCDGHEPPSDRQLLDEVLESPMATPVKKARARPVSEQLLGRSRPQAMYESEDGVLSILDAATNDLAQLINHLDLEATPATPDMTPLRPSPLSADKQTDYDMSPTKPKSLKPSESPLRKTIRASMTSISSLRPYAQSRNLLKAPTATDIGQPIAPWPTLIQGLSPLKESPLKSARRTPPATFRLTHKRTLTPGPEPDPLPVFQPLQPPAKSKRIASTLRVSPSPSSVRSVSPMDVGRAPSSLTFGSRGSSRAGSKGSVDEFGGSLVPSPVFKRAHAGHSRKRSTLAPGEHNLNSRNSQQSLQNHGERDSLPIPPEARRVLGMTGTMGGSDVSGYAVELDASDPDSDIPDELQVILAGQFEDGSVEDTMSYRLPPPSPGCPPEAPLPAVVSGPPVLDLPIFHAQLIDEDQNHADIDEGENTSEEDTKKSFDFTGELKKLNESGASDRRSFVEQLENAFRTPAKVDLRYDFLQVDIPPVPQMPLDLSVAMMEDSSDSSAGFDSMDRSRIIDVKEPTLAKSEDSKSKSMFDVFPGSRILDIKEPTLLQGSDSLGSTDQSDDVVMEEHSSSLNVSTSTSSSRPSDGQLNTSFKFGGRPSPEPSVAARPRKPMTLSDIIPSPAHARSLSNSSAMEGDSVLDSIFAKVADVPQEARSRVDSEASINGPTRPTSMIHSRNPSRSSVVSFSGFDSFDEVRRGFEFSINRPAFYPPLKHESVFSIASVSSYGRVVNAGSADPFDYGLPSLQDVHHEHSRSWIATLGGGVLTAMRQLLFQSPTRARLYNRSFGTHRRNDSSASVSSVAHSYAMFGANGGRAAWAKHRQDASMDSVMSDFSAMRLGRPGIGDKMFDTAADHGMPLTSISASPPESVAHSNYGNRSSFDFDSILDNDRRSSMDDSLFEKTGHRSSMSSDSVFGYDEAYPALRGALLPPNQFRPLSILSMDSIHSPMKENDTMISMLGGGHVRRRSVSSIIDASPCVRVEKRKHSMFQDVQRKGYGAQYADSPNKARIIEKPSIASTSSSKFGGERMIRAQRGLLERQSLEDSCLIADGEDLIASLESIPVFSRPAPTTRSRSSTCTSSSSGGDTPPLSSSDGSSISGGSQSSIDLSDVNMILANATHPMSISARDRVRARARGHGHRRRYSQARASRTSVYETIEEEMSNPSSPARSFLAKASPTMTQPVYIVEPETDMTHNSIWDDERGVVALRKYYALRDEAQDTVTESKRQWSDTPFSVFAVQSFQPPKHPAGMQALLEHSVQNYGPLPSELRPRRVRSRTQSRPSPYPQARITKTAPSPEPLRMTMPDIHRPLHTPPVLQQVPVNSNIISAVPTLDALKPFSPLVLDVEPKRENAFGLAPAARPRVASTARRSALGWSKRSNGKSSSDQKENVSQGSIMTPGESLRLNRPRPRGRPTPASQARPIRI
ncbi:hypothetical protein BD779DRAFT_1663807 [Infundibulicybe gibba]|nr:hypothetical protein BD779DRAFT_1663807 [Infundibulicybe gibba]